MRSACPGRWLPRAVKAVAARLALVLLGALSRPVVADAGGFMAAFGGGEADQPPSGMVAPALGGSGYAAVSWRTPTTGMSQFTIVHIGAGTIDWQQDLSPAPSYGQSAGAALPDDSLLLATGAGRDATSSGVSVLRLAADGSLLRATFDVAAGYQSTTITGLDAAPDGTAWVAGWFYASAVDRFGFVLSLDAAGDLRGAWRISDGSTELYPMAIRSSVAGGVLLSGKWMGGSVSSARWLLELDANGSFVRGATASGLQFQDTIGLEQDSGSGWLLTLPVLADGEATRPVTLVSALDSQLVPTRTWALEGASFLGYTARRVGPDLVVAGHAGNYVAPAVVRVDATGSVRAALGHSQTSFAELLGRVRIAEDGATWATGRRARGPDGPPVAWVTDSDGRIVSDCTRASALGVRATAYSFSMAPQTLSATPITLERSAPVVTLAPSALRSDCASCRPDGFEPDDHAGHGAVLPPEGTVQARDFCDDSEDWFELAACTGRSYDILTRDLGPAADTVVEVFAPDGTTLLASDDDGGGGRASHLAWSPGFPGRYHARVRQKDGAMGADTAYVLEVSSMDAPSATWVRRTSRARSQWPLVTALSTGTIVTALTVGEADPLSGRDDIRVTAMDLSGALSWSSAVGTDRTDQAQQLIATDDGGMLLTLTSAYPSGAEPGVIKLSGDGSVAWALSFADAAYDLLVAARPGGGACVAADARSVPGAGSRGHWVAGVDASGALAWQTVFESEIFTGIAATPDGGCFLVDGSNASAGLEPRIVGLDGTGTVTLAAAVSAAGVMLEPRVVRLADGSLLLTGRLEFPDYSVRMVHLDASLSSGALLVPQSSLGVKRGHVAPTRDGGFLLSATLTNDTMGAQGSSLLARFASGGAISWARALDLYSGEKLSGFAEAPAGTLALAGIARTGAWAGLAAADGSFEGRCLDWRAVPVTLSTTPLTLAPIVVPWGPIAGTPVPLAVNERVLELVLEPGCSCACSTPSSAPEEVSGPLATEPLLFRGRSQIVWENASARGTCTYDLYRGTLASLRAGTVGRCHAFRLESVGYLEEEKPPWRELWTYVVAGSAAGAFGPLGADSFGRPQVAAFPCP